MRDHVTFEQADRAVDFVKNNAEKYGALVGAVKGLEHKRKVVRGIEFLKHDGGSVAEKEARAETSVAYKDIIEEIQNTWAELETLKTLIRAAEMQFDLYRSSNKWGSP